MVSSERTLEPAHAYSLGKSFGENPTLASIAARIRAKLFGMQVEVTPDARAVVREMRERRDGSLSISIGTGCCESTAPFLYEDYLSGPDAEVVGKVEDAQIVAPELLRKLYAGQIVVLDVDRDVIVESLSIETEIDCRLKLALPDAS